MFGLSSAEKYQKIIKKSSIKKIKLPSGAKFKIRKLMVNELMSDNLPLMDNKDLSINSEEKNKQVWDGLNKKQQQEYIDYNNRMVVRAVISPKLSHAPKKGYIFIDDLYNNVNDYLALLHEITIFSIGHGKSKDLAKKKII
jgi:Ulp1 family protease